MPDRGRKNISYKTRINNTAVKDDLNYGQFKDDVVRRRDSINQRNYKFDRFFDNEQVNSNIGEHSYINIENMPLDFPEAIDKIKSISLLPKSEIQQIITRKDILNIIDILQVISDKLELDVCIITSCELEQHPLEVEVQDLIQGKRVIDSYDRSKHGTPLNYLEKYYGKYLKVFNHDNDYLYQPDLNKIDQKFRNNLRMYLANHNQDINDYIPSKSVKIDRELGSLKISDSFLKKIINLNNVKKARLGQS